MPIKKYKVLHDPDPIGLEGFEFTEDEINKAVKLGYMSSGIVFKVGMRHFVLGASGLREFVGIHSARDTEVTW